MKIIPILYGYNEKLSYLCNANIFLQSSLGLLINVAGIRLPAALNIRFLADGAGEKPGNFL